MSTLYDKPLLCSIYYMSMQTINLSERCMGVHTVVFLLMNECITLFCND